MVTLRATYFNKSITTTNATPDGNAVVEGRKNF